MTRKKQVKEIVIPNYFEDLKVVSTTYDSLDRALGGGIELGATIQIAGESGIGKSTIALSTATNLCEQGYNVVYVDTENSITKDLMQSTGAINYINQLNRGKLIVIKENSFDKVEEILDTLITHINISCIFVDSLAGLINKGYLNTINGISITNNNTNYETRPLTLFCNKYNAFAAQYKFALIYLNQFRNKVDFRSSTPTIVKEYGCKIVKYNSDIILWINKSKSSKEVNLSSSGIALGANLEFEIKKSNKTLPNVKIPFYLLYGKGISNIMDLIQLLISKEQILCSGAYYTLIFDDGKKLQGINKVYDYFKENYDSIYSKIKDVIDESAKPITVELTGNS